MTYACIWALWVFSLPVAGKRVAKWLGRENDIIVWVIGTDIGPALLLFLGFNRIIARIFRLKSE